MVRFFSFKHEFWWLQDKWCKPCNRGKGGKSTKLIYSDRSAQLSEESTQIITITEISSHAVGWYFVSKGDLKGFHAVIRHRSGHPNAVFCKISVQRSKYCLKFSFAWGRLIISRWTFHSCTFFETYLISSLRFSEVCFFIFYYPGYTIFLKMW